MHSSDFLNEGKYMKCQYKKSISRKPEDNNKADVVKCTNYQPNNSVVLLFLLFLKQSVFVSENKTSFFTMETLPHVLEWGNHLPISCHFRSETA